MLPDSEYPGPYCKEQNIKSADLLSTETLNETPNPPKNGLIIELFHFVTKNKLPNRKVGIWLQSISSRCCQISLKSLEKKISRTVETEKKFKKKKKHALYNSLDDFQRAFFIADNSSPTDVNNVADQICPIPQKEIVTPNTPPIVSLPAQEFEVKNVPSKSRQQTYAISPNETETCLNNPLSESMGVSSNVSVNEKQNLNKKKLNQLQYEMSKQQRKLHALNNLVQTERDSLENLKSVAGHYSTRNVNKRDENARNTRKNLRELKTSFGKQTRELDSLRTENEELREKLKEIDVQKLKEANGKKTKAQKQASHYRNLVKKVRDNSTEDSMKFELKKKQDELEYLQHEYEMLKEQINEFRCTTKHEDGSFSNNIRLCVMELFALEIGMEKITSAIETVGKHMFEYKFQQKDLPTLTTVRNIVDEGHYLAKSYIAEKIENAENIGISRDGTTRKKEKIVDTSVTLDNGEVMSLGFSKVARETAEVINTVTKTQLTELAETVVNETDSSKSTDLTDEFLARSLEKLSFTMSDRASNEKAANRLLNEWRDTVLDQCGSENEKKSVFQFHCMAHVLLGFHNYVVADLKKFEKEKGPFGRDNLEMFKFWSKKQTTVQRVAYTASGLFGPVGDHLGLRDRWEAYCTKHGVKSLIGNYKDNRFNALFQTAAEVFVHQEDFLEVIKTVPTPNQKIVSVEAVLLSESITTMLRAMAIIYVKITGPYWWLVTSGYVSYLELHSHVQQLDKFVDECTENPDKLFCEESDWISSEDLIIPHIQKYQKKLSSPVPDTQCEFLNEFLSVVCKGMSKTIKKQLVDFLPGGRYSTGPSKEDLNRTSFAQVNNLACEHHFGDLDSSQRRRPNATFHHHSSVQMLKRNRKQLITWINEMPEEKKKMILKKARRGGVDLRKRHRDQEDEVQREILDIMDKGQKTKSRKVVERDIDSEDEYENVELAVKGMLPNMDTGFKENEYIVVAYQDTWYPGCVTKILTEDTASVNFMIQCRNQGTYMWPTRKDVQVVEKQFVLKRDILPECRNSGRQWYFADHQTIDALFKKYKDIYF